MATPSEEYSPSNRFKLVVTSTPKGLSGVITRVSDSKEIITIVRQSYAFHHSWWIKDGEEYLHTGTDVISQTIVNLESGRVFESSGKSKFCWASSWLSPDGMVLAVHGCFWAAPYEFKFFDFSNPEQGWPELKLTGVDYVDYRGEKLPEWDSDNQFVVYDTVEYIKHEGRMLKQHSKEWTALIRLNTEIPDEDFIDVPVKTTYLKRIGDEMTIVKTVIAEQ